MRILEYLNTLENLKKSTTTLVFCVVDFIFFYFSSFDFAINNWLRVSYNDFGKRNRTKGSGNRTKGSGNRIKSSENSIQSKENRKSSKNRTKGKINRSCATYFYYLIANKLTLGLF